MGVLCGLCRSGPAITVVRTFCWEEEDWKGFLHRKMDTTLSLSDRAGSGLTPPPADRRKGGFLHAFGCLRKSPATISNAFSDSTVHSYASPLLERLRKEPQPVNPEPVRLCSITAANSAWRRSRES